MPDIKWNKETPHKLVAYLGPIALEVSRYRDPYGVPEHDEPDEWSFTGRLRNGGAGGPCDGVAVVTVGHSPGPGVPLERCKTDATAAIERWLDAVRAALPQPARPEARGLVGEETIARWISDEDSCPTSSATRQDARHAARRVFARLRALGIL